MAIANSDGSIILSTKIDTSGIKRGTANLKTDANRLVDAYKKVGLSQRQAFDMARKSVASAQQQLVKVNATLQEQRARLYELQVAQSNLWGSAKLGFEASNIKNEIYDVSQQIQELQTREARLGMSQRDAMKKISTTIAEQKAKLYSLNVEYAKFIASEQTSSVEAVELRTKIDALSAEMRQNEQTVAALGIKTESTLAGMTTAVKSLLSYFIGLQTVMASIRFSGSSAVFATQTEASIQRLVDIYGSASDSVGDFIDANARALGMSKVAAASFSSVYGNLFSVWADQATNAELTNRYLNMTAVVASKTGRTVEDVQERVRSGLLGNTEAIEDLGIFVNVKTIEMTDAFKRMANGKSWEQLDASTQQQIRSMAILEQSTAKYGDEVADTSATIRNRFNAAYQDFQNSWGNIVNTVLLPVLETLTQIFDIATKGLNALSGRSGQILENVEQQEENTGKTADNIEKQAEAQKDLNDQMKKTLAGFDDIQILSANISENESEPPKSNLNLSGFGGDGSGVVSEVNETMALIMGIVGFSLAALGIILLCFGQIGWGIGLLIAGIGVFAVSEAAIDNVMSENVKNTLNAVLSIASAALLVLGIILVCTGVGIPLGIGLIIAGAAGLATVVAINWNSIVDWVKRVWDAVKDFWNKYIAPVFTAQWWLDLGKTCINGLIAGFEGGINVIIGAFEKMINWIVDGLNKISFDIPAWLGGGHFGLNIPNVSLNRLSIPRLAQGAVIPPNREFLAVLGDQKQGTNIEAPLQTIVDAFNIALSHNSGYNGGGNTEVVLEIDGREFGRAVVEQGNKENRRIGTRLVIS